MTVRLVPGRPSTYVFLPAYYSDASHLEGIELPSAAAACLTGVYRVADLSRFPMLLDLVFEPDWEQAPLVHTLASIERAWTGAALPRIYANPPDLIVRRAALEQPLDDSSADVTHQATIVRHGSAAEWVVRGRPESPTSDLLRFNARQTRKGALFIAQGELRTGGLSLSLLHEGERMITVAVQEPGPFLVALAVPVSGDVAALVANNVVTWWPASHIGRRVGPLVEWLPGATLRNDFVLSRVGWLQPERN
jgi:hypothetical protein